MSRARWGGRESEVGRRGGSHALQQNCHFHEPSRPLIKLHRTRGRRWKVGGRVVGEEVRHPDPWGNKWTQVSLDFMELYCFFYCMRLLWSAKSLFRHPLYLSSMHIDRQGTGDLVKEIKPLWSLDYKELYSFLCVYCRQQVTTAIQFIFHPYTSTGREPEISLRKEDI